VGDFRALQLRATTEISIPTQSAGPLIFVVLISIKGIPDMPSMANSAQT
jgi:hypothetical protein